jgi:hypothetical protein
MGPRRSTPARILDDRSFAVRIRFRIPENGLSCASELHSWLRQRTQNQFAIHSATFIGGAQCSAIYVNEPAIAIECIEKFGLEVYGLRKESP